MKHNYKIQVDAPLPSDEQIAKHKDFNQVMQEYQKFTQPLYKRPLYKNPKVFLGVALIVVIAFLVFEAVDEEKKTPIQEKTDVPELADIPSDIILSKENSLLKPLLPALAPAFKPYTIEVHKQEFLHLVDGSRIEVLPNSFALPDGSPALGEVQLEIRVLHNPLEHVLANLPMNLQDGSAIWQSGTFELKARSGSTPLKLLPGKKITVRFPHIEGQPDAPLQLWGFDTQKQAWVADPNAEVITQPSKSKTLKSDGFGVVEFGPNGKKTKKPNAEAPKMEIVDEFSISTLGIFCVGSTQPASEGKPVPVRLTSGGKPLPLHQLYRLSKGSSTAGFYWPVRADFTFMVPHAQAGEKEVLFGFLPNGKMAWIDGSQIQATDDEAGVGINANVSPNPIRAQAELMQLLGI